MASRHRSDVTVVGHDSHGGSRKTSSMAMRYGGSSLVAVVTSSRAAYTFAGEHREHQGRQRRRAHCGGPTAQESDGSDELAARR